MLSQYLPSLENWKHVFLLVLRVISWAPYVFPPCLLKICWTWTISWQTSLLILEFLHWSWHHMERTFAFTSIFVFNFFKIIFITSSWFDFFMNSLVVVWHSSYQKTQTIRHSSCSREVKLIYNKIKVHYIIFWGT